jgi:CBS domain-containing protein
MRAMDVMTNSVITVSPETSVRDVAKLLCEYGISGVPVIDGDNRMIGIVTEGDLLHRTETATEHQTERRQSRWLDTLTSDRELARDYVKSHGQRVRDIMTRDVVSVECRTELAEIATLFETKRIKRVPVIRDGQLVGIVSRASLVRALAASGGTGTSATESDDRGIRRQLLSELGRQEWAKVWAADVVVQNRVVHIWCSDDQSPEERDALRVAAENTAGVRGVEQHIVPAPATPAY